MGKAFLNELICGTNSLIQRQSLILQISIRHLSYIFPQTALTESNYCTPKAFCMTVVKILRERVFKENTNNLNCTQRRDYHSLPFIELLQKCKEGKQGGDNHLYLCCKTKCSPASDDLTLPWESSSTVFNYTVGSTEWSGTMPFPWVSLIDGINNIHWL